MNQQSMCDDTVIVWNDGQRKIQRYRCSRLVNCVDSLLVFVLMTHSFLTESFINCPPPSPPTPACLPLYPTLSHHSWCSDFLLKKTRGYSGA